MDSYYEILGVEPCADPTTVRAAYRRAAKATHPDTNASDVDGAAFLSVHAAWQVLSDPARRAAYDERISVLADHPPAPQPPAGRRARPTASAQAPSQGENPHVATPDPAPQPRQGPRWLLWAAGTVTATTGGLTVALLAAIGRPAGVVAVLYLAAVGIGLLGLVRSARGSTAGEGTYRRLLARLIGGAWILAAAFATLALLLWASGRAPVAPLVWAVGVAVFATATTVLVHAIGNRSE